MLINLTHNYVELATPTEGPPLSHSILPLLQYLPMIPTPQAFIRGCPRPNCNTFSSQIVGTQRLMVVGYNGIILQDVGTSYTKSVDFSMTCPSLGHYR